MMSQKMQRIRISAVSYLNTKPFLYGIQNSDALARFDLELKTDLPSVCADKLLNGEVDLGLVPVAIIPELKQSHIVSNYCIGSSGPVKTVMLYSNVPLNEVSQVMLDYQSRTSVMLARVLARELWGISPEFLPAFKGFEQGIKDNKAAVVIGDRTFAMNGKFKFEFDLAEEWKKLTGLPFVFACWVANKPLDENFLKVFNAALEVGISSVDEVARINEMPGVNLREYFSSCISYNFTVDKKTALELFLKKLQGY